MTQNNGKPEKKGGLAIDGRTKTTNGFGGNEGQKTPYKSGN
jgi:hypothetical protein